MRKFPAVEASHKPTWVIVAAGIPVKLIAALPFVVAPLDAAESVTACRA
jgi:hypothetical protein